MRSLSLILAIVTLIMALMTLGCGFAVRYGGEAFRNAVSGHMVLGIILLIAAFGSVISHIVVK